ncbi:hypothetical protein QUF63_11240 [Anaerolineales bacterium HSG25]|nr:hypothetical protein [Anaerolineales bacterium HSG25]
MSTTKQPTIGEQLCTALTQTEIAELLSATITELPSVSLSQILNRLTTNTRQTIEQVLSPPDPTAADTESQAIPVSVAKLEEEWLALWKEWDKIVHESSLENGKYVPQDEHWEPPYFDGYDFVKDLDGVAYKMRPLLETAFEHEFSFPSGSFALAMMEAEDEAGSDLPEWSEIMDGFGLDVHLTYCILQWEWLTAQHDGESAYEFAEAIRRLEDDFSQTSLFEDTVTNFFTTLPENAQHVIYDGLTAHKSEPLWAKALQNSRTMWHSIYIYWLDQYNPARYLETKRATISQQWQNGLPVIDDYLDKKAYQQADSVLQETVTAMLARNRELDGWFPEDSLLYPTVGIYVASDEDYKQLLNRYLRLAKAQKQPERVAVLQLQLLAFRKFYDWQAMLNGLTELPTLTKIRQRLFLSWRDPIVRQCNPSLYHSRDQESFWVEWLLTAIFEEEKGAIWFQQKLNNWLRAKPTYELLQMLTADVAAFSPEMVAFYPKFENKLIKNRPKHGQDYASRRNYLKQYAPPNIAEQLINYWRANILQYVPNPKDVHKADYTNHATWMGVVKELAPSAYDTLLSEWQTDHHRRRNLWQAMRNEGLG